MKIETILTKYLVKKACARNTKAKGNLRDYVRAKEGRERDITAFGVKIKELERSIKDFDETLPVIKSSSLKKARDIEYQLNKHSAFEGLEYENGHLSLKTKILFADIRVESGSKKTEKTCLGSFEIRFPTDGFSFPDNMKFYNRIFDMRYPHWGVSGANVCWGDWRYEIQKKLEKEDLYGIFDTCVHYLREAEMDGAAYIRSNSWKSSRKLHSRVEMYSFKQGDYVMCMAPEVDDVMTLGRVGRIASSINSDLMSGSCCVDFRGDKSEESPVSDTTRNNVSYCRTFAWFVPIGSLRPIDNKIHDARAVYSLVVSGIQSPSNLIIEKLDSMAPGSTTADVDEIIESFKNDTSMKVDIRQFIKI